MLVQTDNEIIKEILGGNINAYEKIVDRYAEHILNLSYRYLETKEEAEDATQDIFIKSYKALNKWQPRAQFKTWLYCIAINHCLNLTRRKKIIQFQSIQKLEEEYINILNKKNTADQLADIKMVNDQREKTIKYYINQLPQNQKEVIILYYYQQLSYKEIADVLDTSISSIESRLFRAKKKLAKMLSK